jgi:hypothetical protein
MILSLYAVVAAVAVYALVKALQSPEDDPDAALKAEAKAAPFWWETEDTRFVEDGRRYRVTRVVDPARESVSRMYVGADGRLFEETPA